MIRHDDLRARVRRYWEGHLHDERVSAETVGSRPWFDDLSEYRYGKLGYILRDLEGLALEGREVLDVGCGVGLDLEILAHRAGGATGIDLSRTALALARRHLQHRGTGARLLAMDVEEMAFRDASFDLVWSNGCLPFVVDPELALQEIHRVLRPGGIAVLMFYHAHSWFRWVSLLTRTRPEHADAPVQRMATRRQVRTWTARFRDVQITSERDPEPTRMHGGAKAQVYNRGFVPLYRLLPGVLKRRWGWHLIVRARK